MTTIIVKDSIEQAPSLSFVNSLERKGKLHKGR